MSHEKPAPPKNSTLSPFHRSLRELPRGKPAAVSEAAGRLADSLLTKVSSVELWARGSGMPLPETFSEGKSAWKTVSTMTNPVHRVHELDQNADMLEDGHTAIHACAAFVEKHGNTFTETIVLKNQLDGIAHLTENGCSIREFIAAWNDAVLSASFADPEVWDRILSLRGKAELELKEHILGWKEETQTILDEACTTLPDTLTERNLDPALAEAWSAPLTRLLSEMDAISVPAQVANLPAQARREVGAIEGKIDKEVARIAREREREEGVKERPKTTQSLKSFVTKKTLTTVDDWIYIRDAMDSKIRRLIDDGFDVELE